MKFAEKQPELSVIIVSYNTRQLLLNCVRSVQQQFTDIDFEIIVVDNASSDGSADAVEREFPKVRVIRNSENVGFARANNLGFNIAKGSYYLLLNTDTVVLGSPRPIIDFFERTPYAGIIGCKLWLSDGSLQLSGSHYPHPLLEWLYFCVDIVYRILPFISHLKHRGINFNREGEVDCVSGNGMFLRSEVVAESKGFDPNFFMYYEDTELCFRIRNHLGWNVHYHPSFEIIHYHGKSSIKSRATVFAYNSFLYFLGKTKGKKEVQLFNNICKVCWCLDIAFLSMMKLFTESSKPSLKIILLKELLTQ